MWRLSLVVAVLIETFLVHNQKAIRKSGKDFLRCNRQPYTLTPALKAY
jgi:hypothetical protein